MDIENKENYFPWMEEIVHSFAKYFMTDYDIDILSFLHRNIDEEIHLISSSHGYTVSRSKALYKELTHIYEHMRLKMVQHSDLPNTALSCVKLLSQLIKIGLILTQGLTDSEWIERIMTAIKLFSGKKDSIYDALLLVNGLKKIHHKPYALILKCILEDHHDHATDPLVYMEIILLYRRLKALLPIKSRDQCNISVTKIKPPINLISWLKSLDVEESFHLPKNLQYKKVALHLMRKNISQSLLKNLRDMVLNRYCFKDNSNKFKSRNKEDQPLDMFIIDTSSKKEEAAEIEVNSLKNTNTNSKPQRKRKKPESLPNNDVEVIENEDINNEVLFINSYSNSLVEDDLQLAQKKHNNTCISESNVEIGILSTTCLESNEQKMSTKKKKKKAKNHRKQAKNNESGTASVKSQPDSESAFSQSDMLLKKSKQICESVTVTSLSPKRSISDDTDNSKFILEKQSSTKSIKKLKLLGNSKESSEYSDDEIRRKSADMTPLHILMDKNKMCMVDFQNNLSFNNNVGDETNSNRSYENISSTKDQYFSPSPSEKLNNDNEINDNKNVYFKKLMLRKITSETKALCEQDQTDGKISNLNILSKETSIPINEVFNPSNSPSNTVICNYGKDPKLVKQQSDNNDKTVSRNTAISNSPFEKKECLNNISQDECSSVNAVDSENLEVNKDINRNNIPNSIKEKNVLCKDPQSPLVLESLSQKQLFNESIKDTDCNGKKLSDLSMGELTPGSVPSDNLHSSRKILHLDCTVSSPEEKGWDRMKVFVDGSKSKIKIDIDIGMNMESFTYKNDSKSTHTHISNLEQKLSGSTFEDAPVKETVTSSEKSTVCESSNLELKISEKSSIESHAKVTDMSSEKEPCDKSKELSNLDNKLLIECSSETSTLKTHVSSDDGSTLESKSTLLHNLYNKFPSEPSNKDKPEKNQLSSDSSSVSPSNSFLLIGLEHERPSGFSSNDLTNNDKTSASPSSNTLSESKSVELSYFRHELPLKFSKKDVTDDNQTSDLESEIPAKLPSENNTNEVDILSEDGDVSQSKSSQLSSVADGELAPDCSNKGEIEKTLMTSITKQGQLLDSEHKSVCVDKNSRSETCLSVEGDSKSNACLEESQSKDVSNVDFDHLKVCSEDNNLLKETQISSKDDFASDNKKSHTASDSFNVCETTDKICLFDNSVVLEHTSNFNDLNKNPQEDVDFITSKSLDSETEVVSYLSAEIADQTTNEPQAHGKSALESDKAKLVNKAENIENPEEKTKIFAASETHSLTTETSGSAVHTNEHSHGVFENSESQLIKSQNVDVKAVNVNDEIRLSITNPVTSSVVKSEELNDTVNDAENLIKIAGKPDEQSIELQNNIKETPVSEVHTSEHSLEVFGNSESQLVKSQNVDDKAIVNANDESRLSVTNPVISSVVKSEDLNDTAKDANNSIKIAGKPDEQSIESQNNIKQTVNVDSNLDHSTENSNSLQNNTNIQLSNKSTEVLNENSFTEKITDNLQDLTDKASSVENSNNCNTCSTSKLCFCNKENLSNDVTSERVITKSLVKSDSKGQYDNELEIKDSVISSTSKFGEINFSCPSSLTNNDCKQVQNNYLKAGTISDGTSKSFSLSEKQNEFKTFSDISQKNKDKSINVDSGLKDTSPITKFSSAASTELFSMYRNVMLHDENYKIPSPRGVTPEKGDVFLITDDIKSYSSDHSDNDSDSKHCSEEMEALGEDVKVTSENGSSLEIDDSSLSKKSDIFADKKENEVIDENEASNPPVDVSNSLDNTDGKDTFEKEVKLFPRQSLRLQNKIESQNKNNSDENSGSDTSKPEKISLQCCDIILDDKHCFEIDYSGPESKSSHSASQNAREIPCTSNSKKSAVDHQPVIKKSLSNAKNILKDKSKDCKTPSNSYSLRKSSRRKDNSANLGIDLNKLVIDSPSSSKDSSSRKTSKYVKWLTSEYESKTEDSDSKHSVIRETRSSTVQSEKESKEDPPSYNLRNRKSILRPARLKI